MKRAIVTGLLAPVLIAPGLACATTAFILETGTPAGFEDLSEARPLVVDVYYGGQLIGTATASVDPGFIEFVVPEALIPLLPETLAPDRLISALSQPLPRNARKICRSASHSGCGYLAPAEYKDAGLIFDESRFRVDLFLAPDLLPRQSAISDPFLPESSTGFSFIQNLAGTWSGVRSESGEDAHSSALLGDTILSYGEHGLHSQWALTDEQSQVYQLYWNHDYRGHAWSAGLIYPESDIGGFALSPQLYGIEYRSSTNSRTDQRYTQGAPLEVNMPVRGRVEVRRDERLVHSQLLEAGNRLLDTSSMPSGAYEVEIRTFDESGRLLGEFRQFFAKDARLPAPGEWRWAIQAGQPVRHTTDMHLPEALDDYITQVGLARRLYDNTSVFGNFATTTDEQLIELGSRWVGPGLEIAPSVVHTADGRSGFRLNMLARISGITVSASEARLDAAPPVDRSSNRYPLLSSGYRQRNFALSGNALDWRYTLRHTERDNRFYTLQGSYLPAPYGDSAQKLSTLEFRRNILRSANWLGDVTLTHSIADGEHLTLASVEFRFNGNQRNHSARLQAGQGRGAPGTRAAFTSHWHNAPSATMRVDQQISGELSEYGSYLGGQFAVSGRRGRASATAAYRNGDEYQSFNYLGSFNTSVLSTENTFAWGGDNTLDSAVVVGIDGGDDQPFEILVDGVRRGTAVAGERSVIRLPAFGSYDLQLKPMADGFFDYRESQQTVTLYPGNVAKTSYAVETIVLVLGRLVKDGTPLANTRISIGKHSTVTDEFGVFQMEMPVRPGKLQSPPVIWGNCRVPLPTQSAGEHWLNLGVVNLDSEKCTAESEKYAANGGSN
ncbi:TcfC E-set like domain-containing protein [uncultured Microbulbifer sp.]|uniref:TcfC E-set like domain-containing protein n=1 Tax=uncultured Microbulbifer sp. TaxID=348147 RepID=UPI0026147F1F|nr:TcfC E-set like domain-containing protein [uncultured Microbulbifer sp.]